MFTTRGTNFDKLVDKMFNDISEPIWKTTFFSSDPLEESFSWINARVEDGIIYLALPGYYMEDIDINIQGRMLQVSANIKKEDENPFRKTFTKKWYLADDANVDDVKATMLNGLLTISFGKTTENKKIKIS
jgi:HSP20 family molecular chaperone IbpA